MRGQKSVQILGYHIILTGVVSCLILKLTWAINNPSRGCGKEMPDALNPGQTIQFNVTYNDSNLGPIPRLYHMQLPKGITIGIVITLLPTLYSSAYQWAVHSTYTFLNFMPHPSLLPMYYTQPLIKSSETQ